MRRFFKISTLDYVVFLCLVALVAFEIPKLPTSTVAERGLLAFGALAVLVGLASLLAASWAYESDEKTRRILGDIAENLDRQVILLQKIARGLEERPKETPIRRSSRKSAELVRPPRPVVETAEW